MGGGYIRCGEFLSDDKSGLAISGIVEELRSLPAWEPDGDLAELVTAIHAFVSGEDVRPQDWVDWIEITSDEIIELTPYLEQCRANLANALGTTDRFAAIEQEQNTSTLDPTELKWGKRAGWRLYCVTDLLRAAEHSKENGESIYLTFD